MHAIEFTTELSDSRMLSIPQEVAEQLPKSGRARIIVLTDELTGDRRRTPSTTPAADVWRGFHLSVSVHIGNRKQDSPGSGAFMTCYLVTANFWLLVALTLFVGRTFERDSPTRYSVFHCGQWFSSETYSLLIFTVLAAAACFFVLTWKTRNQP